MVVLSGSEKGGSGKSTLAVFIAGMAARRGLHVVLIDADPQGTAATWAQRRTREDVPDVEARQHTGPLQEPVSAYSSQADLCVIDAGGRDSVELRSAMVACDVLVLPVEPSSADVWALQHMRRLIEQAQERNGCGRVAPVVSRAYADPRIPETQELRDLLDGLGMPAAATVCSRVDYRRALGLSLTPVELPAAPKAIEELATLYDALQIEAPQP